MFGKILEKATYIKAKIKKDQLEVALAEATTEDNWQASTTVLHQIASSAYDHDKWRKISDFLWDKLRNKKNWKKILKSLNIVEFLLKNGPEFVCGELRMEKRFFKAFESFQEYEGTVDRGASIRKCAKSVVELLQDYQLLEDERLRAHQIRQKMSRIAGGSKEQSGRPSSHVPKYESYNSQTFTKSQDNKGFYNYGHGLYGDRFQDKKYDHDYFGNAQRFKQNEQAEKPRPKSSITVPDNQPPPEPKPQPKPKPVNHFTSGPTPGATNTFTSITESLMRKKKKVQEVKPVAEQVVVPDLSYKKKKEPQAQLIDFEEAFMETRYNFQEKPQPAEVPVKQPENQAQYQPQPQTQPQVQQPQPQPQPVSLPQPKIEAPQPAPQVKMNQNDTNAFLGAPTSVPTSIQQNIQPQTQPQPQPIVQPPQVQPTFNQISTAPPPSGPFGSYSAPPPAYGYPGTYNQFNTYNSFGPSYYNPNQSSYFPVPPPVYTAPTYPPQPQPQPIYSAPTSAPSAQSNPYANLPSGQFGMGNVTFTGQQTSQKESRKEQKKENSSKNGMGNLTDLSDLMEQIEQTKKSTPKKKSQTSNGIVIDQWAW